MQEDSFLGERGGRAGVRPSFLSYYARSTGSRRGAMHLLCRGAEQLEARTLLAATDLEFLHSQRGALFAEVAESGYESLLESARLAHLGSDVNLSPGRTQQGLAAASTPRDDAAVSGNLFDSFSDAPAFRSIIDADHAPLSGNRFLSSPVGESRYATTFTSRDGASYLIDVDTERSNTGWDCVTITITSCGAGVTASQDLYDLSADTIASGGDANRLLAPSVDYAVSYFPQVNAGRPLLVTAGPLWVVAAPRVVTNIVLQSYRPAAPPDKGGPTSPIPLPTSHVLDGGLSQPPSEVSSHLTGVHTRPTSTSSARSTPHIAEILARSGASAVAYASSASLYSSSATSFTPLVLTVLRGAASIAFALDGAAVASREIVQANLVTLEDGLQESKELNSTTPDAGLTLASELANAAEKGASAANTASMAAKFGGGGNTFVYYAGEGEFNTPNLAQYTSMQGNTTGGETNIEEAIAQWLAEESELRWADAAAISANRRMNAQNHVESPSMQARLLSPLQMLNETLAGTKSSAERTTQYSKEVLTIDRALTAMFGAVKENPAVWAAAVSAAGLVLYRRRVVRGHKRPGERSTSQFT